MKVPTTDGQKSRRSAARAAVVPAAAAEKTTADTVANGNEATDASASEPAVVESSSAVPAEVLDTAKQCSDDAVAPKRKRASKV